MVSVVEVRLGVDGTVSRMSSDFDENSWRVCSSLSQKRECDPRLCRSHLSGSHIWSVGELGAAQRRWTQRGREEGGKAPAPARPGDSGDCQGLRPPLCPTRGLPHTLALPPPWQDVIRPPWSSFQLGHLPASLIVDPLCASEAAPPPLGPQVRTQGAGLAAGQRLEEAVKIVAMGEHGGAWIAAGP